MRRRLVSLGIAAGLCAGYASAYTYDYSKNPVVADSTRWNTNGTVTFGSGGASFSSGGGSLIDLPTISGANPNDYEIISTLYVAAGDYGGTFIHFMRASSSTVVSGSGSYVSAELAVPNTGQLTLKINSCVSGVVTTLSTVSNIRGLATVTFRTVIWGTNLWVFVNGKLLAMQPLPSATPGNPGIGGYSMNGHPSSSAFTAINLGPHYTGTPTAVPTQSVPVSPPPMTTTSLPVAEMKLPFFLPSRTLLVFSVRKSIAK